jgi:uncharacterized protein
MKPPRVVLDTNVLISALLFGGTPREILHMIIAGVIDCSISSAILDELREVLQRPKFGFSAQQALSVVEELSDLCEVVSPSKRVYAVKNDPDDNRILECALQAKADVVVSGDAHLLALSTHEGVRILSPSDFLKQTRRTTPTRKGKRKPPFPRRN